VTNLRLPPAHQPRPGLFPDDDDGGDWSGSTHLRSLPALTSLALEGVLADPLEGLLQDAAACSHLTSLGLSFAVTYANQDTAPNAGDLVWDCLLSDAAFSGSIRCLMLQPEKMLQYRQLHCLIKPWMVAKLLVELMPQLEGLEVDVILEGGAGGAGGEGGEGGLLLVAGGAQQEPPEELRRLSAQLRAAGLPVAGVAEMGSGRSAETVVWEEGSEESRLTCRVEMG
jgi:hypothetical protein